MRLLLPLVLFSFAARAQTRADIRDLKAGRVREDTSFVYSLPWEKGKKHLLVQAYLSSFSHKGEIALDFKMKKGTKICAARAGVVVALREDSDRGGLKPEYLSDGNYLIIRHADGSHANYWHLQQNGVLVNIGEAVEEGQVIARSGNTGYSAFPHLHFEVTGGLGVGRGQVPTRFRTRKGDRYLRPLRWYRRQDR